MELSLEVIRKLIGEFPQLDEMRQAKADMLKEIKLLTEPLPYGLFYTDYLLPNIPVVLGQWATADWPCRHHWFDPDGYLKLDLLDQLFGSAIVPVADCQKQESYAHQKTEMSFSEFISYIRGHSDSQHIESLLYLKDWHFFRDFHSYHAYTTPNYFQSDWLNEFWDFRADCDDDYRFLYFGPKGSWTPFHADVLRSFSWSANISGKKKWLIFRAGDEANLVTSGGRLPFKLDETSLKENSIKYFEVIQNAGEVIFIPSGWHHQVHNLENTLSINHNWLNASNIDICWKFVVKSLASVEREIEEYRHTMDNWLEHCQLFLRADIGMDFIDFYNLLHVIGRSRLTALEHEHSVVKCVCSTASSSNCICSHRGHVGSNHAVYDLFRTADIIKEMTGSQLIVDIFSIGRNRLLSWPDEFLTELRSAVDGYLNVH